MNRIAADVQRAFDHAGEKTFPVEVEEIVIDKQAADSLLDYIKRKNNKHIVLVCDSNTHRIAGIDLENRLNQEGFQAECLLIPENEAGDVTADERSLIHVLLHTKKTTEVMIAVGSGTIHDIVRFTAFQRGLPFISYPTAPSVDGFTSAGAPLILYGKKTTIQTKAPVALFADVNLLKAAPQSMVAAGFGDMLGKITSLADWEISRHLAGEPYSPTGAKIVQEALDACIEHIEDIAKKTETGIRVLMESLIVSGLVMLALNHSRPASGGEHHISHWIEMELMEKKRPQILHGAKVGCAAALLTDTYRKLAQDDGLHELSPRHQQAVQSAYQTLPEGKVLADWLRSAGGPAAFDEIGVGQSSVMNAFRNAHTLRDRCTGLKIMNENQTLINHGLYE
ncbi:sn-glycerol-1-phosphate dehydrogenase [Bacillus mexicanus]|uniref:sn-glycerol-1-phosphate dehydrogenase n=1 Tax=Bacillus mexicanus TaxID=2834415 RepID=UPI003D1E4DE2